MGEMNVMFIYPVESDKNEKEFKLNQTELMTLMLSQKVGSDGSYYNIEEKIFEDCKDGSKSITIILGK